MQVAVLILFALTAMNKALANSDTQGDGDCSCQCSKGEKVQEHDDRETTESNRRGQYGAKRLLHLSRVDKCSLGGLSCIEMTEILAVHRGTLYIRGCKVIGLVQSRVISCLQYKFNL